MPKPFFSARIPEDLHERIKAHVTEGKESKTDLLVNALRAYLDLPAPSGNEEDTQVSQRLDCLEKEVAELKQLVSKISASRDTQSDNKSDNANDNNSSLIDQLSVLEQSLDNKVDNETDNNKTELSHTDVAKQTGLGVSTVRGYHSSKKDISKGGVRYTPARSGKHPIWLVEKS